MKVVIVIPTYNEAENIKKLIPALLEVFKQIPKHECHILVVDGNSPDNTANIVSEFAKENEYVHLLKEKEKSGLGGAYIYAFKYAMENLKPDVIMEMDADFQHDPKEIPNFIKKIEEGYDYVIGSRFIKGGSIPKEWGLNRKFWSVGGNIFAKVVLGIRSVNDFTSGFRASRVKNYLSEVDLDSIRSKGFAYKIDLLYKMHKVGAKITEIPIEFKLRDKGNSKMESNNPIDSLKVVLSIRYNENRNFFKFCIVGLCGLFTDTTLFNIFRITIFHPRDAAIAAGALAMMVTFTLNNLWSFKERKIKGVFSIVTNFIFYSATSTVPILVRSQLVDLFVRALGNTLLVANTGFFLGITFGIIWNYTIYSRIIWAKNSKQYD